MSQNAIENSSLINIGKQTAPIDLFTPAVKLEFNVFDPVPLGDPFFGVQVTDETIYPPGVNLKVLHISFFNQKTGVELREQITVTGTPGSKTINLLGFGEDFRVTVVVITTDTLRADGSANYRREDNNLPQPGMVDFVSHWSKKG